jgi:hypothetical protein
MDPAHRSTTRFAAVPQTRAGFRAAVVIAGAATIIGVGAPDARAQDVTYGVKGGVHLGTLQVNGGDAAGSLDWRPGLVGGGFLAWPLAGRLDVQPELLFTQKGASAEEDGGTVTQKLDYLDVPVLVSYRLFGEAGRRFSGFVGPAFGLRLRARSRASFGGDTLEQDVSEQVKRTDLAIVGGLAYHRGRVVVDGRYSWGISDIDRDTDDDLEIRTRGMTFLIGWKF